MLFQNNGETTKIRLQEASGYIWKTVRHGDQIDIPEIIGRTHGFEQVDTEMPKTTKGKIGKKTVETKQLETGNFEEKLTKIKGLGKKTAKDIVALYPTEESLKNAIKNGKSIPVRDDIESKLKKKFK